MNVTGISMFRKPLALKNKTALSYQNFPPLATKKSSYSAATKVAPKCALNFCAAAKKEEAVPPPVDVVPPPLHLDAFDYHAGMLRAAHVIYQRHLQYCADDGVPPSLLEWNDDDFETPEEYTSTSSYCDDDSEDCDSIE